MTGKIIFVNSYKGGAGKTTLSLMHCIDDLFHEKKYGNVIYMDLDILGTGTRYLFEESKLPEDKCFDCTEDVVTVELNEKKETAQLHVAYLSPSFKGHSALGGKHLINHQEIAEEILAEKVIRFIKRCIKAKADSLFVLDCAPGFSKFEQKILKKCYEIALEGNVEIQEEYVTTLDSSHIKKCILCLNDMQKSLGIDVKYRKIHFVINDMQNFEKHMLSKLSGSAAIDAVNDMWDQIAADIKGQLINKEIEVFRWKYSEAIAVRTTFHNERKLENQVHDYVFTTDSYKKC